MSGIGWLILKMSVILFLQLPQPGMVSFVKKSSHAGRHGDCAQTQQCKHLFNRAVQVRIPTLPEAEAHPEPPIWHTDGEPPSVCRVGMLDDFHHGKNSISSYQTRLLLWIKISFSCSESCFSDTAGRHGVSYPLSPYSTWIISEWLQHYGSSMAYADRKCLSYHIFHQDYVQWQLFGGNVLDTAGHVLNQWCVHAAVSPLAGWQRSGNQEMECEPLLPWLLLIMHQQDVASCFYSFGLCLDFCLEIFVFREEILSSGDAYCFHYRKS